MKKDYFLSVEKNVLSFTKILKKDETYQFDERASRLVLHVYKKPQIVRGVTSMCADGKHILMLDYDNICRWIVEAELKELSKKGFNVYLFSTKEEIKDGIKVGNYHALSLSKLTANEVLYYQQKTSCDQSYMTMPLRNRFRSWVLRISEKKGSGKPTFVKQFLVPRPIHIQSSAHGKLLEKKYGIIISGEQDRMTKLYFNEYETR